MSGGLDGLRALVRLVARGMRAQPGALPTAGSPRRRPAVERAGLVADPRRVRRYLAATGGEGIAAFQGDDALLPPLFPATWQTAAALELLASLEPPLAVAGVVHLEEETTLLRFPAAGDRFRCRVELERAEPARGGVRLALSVRNWTEGGLLCAQSTLAFLVRTRGADRTRPSGGGAVGAAPAAEPAWEELDRWRLSAGEGRRYARASGDFNPIHLWGLTARPFGFAGPILHGYATEARVAHALVQRRLGGDPHALRRLRIAFRAPLALPATVSLQLAEDGARHLFRVAGTEGGPVFAEGDFGGGS